MAAPMYLRYTWGVLGVHPLICHNVVVPDDSRQKSVSELFGVPKPPANSRDQLVSTAIDLFYRHGFNCVGIDQVLAKAGLSKTTFYKHFESKDDLMVAAVRTRDEWELQAWDRAVRDLVGDDPREQLRGYFQVLDQWFTAPDFGGCMFINVASEFPNPHDPVHQVAADHKRKGRDAYRDLAAEAGAKDPEAFANHYTMLMEGALILRQVHGRDNAAAIAMDAVVKLIDDHIPLQRFGRG